ncbi:MAG: class I SAM-dependent methyltransferase [Rhodanobacteraceae bacterium]
MPCYAPTLAHESPGFKPEHFARLAELEDGHFWFRARNELIVQVLRKNFPHARNMLEIGCGTGFVLRGVTRAMPDLRVSGSEIFLEGLSFAAQRLPGADLFQMDARRIPYEDEFDLIGAFDVIEHIEEDGQVLSEIHRALKRGGGAIFTVPQHPALWSAQDESACHVRRYRRHELAGKLRANGFTIVFSTSFVSLLLPLLAFSRWRKRKPPADARPDGEFTPGALVNSALYHVLHLESLLIRSGLRFPIGGTRLVAAVKAA